VGTVVSIMDRPGWEANTDVIVVAFPRLRTLVWVPRDVLSVRHGTRINAVFADHGHAGLVRAVRDLGLFARHSVCLQRGLTEQLLEEVSVEVPVPRPLEYWYPLEPQARIEDGRRLVRFDPPSERLDGVRIHEWLGARLGVDRYAGDDERIRRQQVFVRELLRTGFDPAVAARRDLWDATGPRAVADLRAVNAGWRMGALAQGVPVTHNGQMVSIRSRVPGSPGRWLARRVARRIGAVA
jgi:hypothetical protein